IEGVEAALISRELFGIGLLIGDQERRYEKSKPDHHRDADEDHERQIGAQEIIHHGRAPAKKSTRSPRRQRAEALSCRNMGRKGAGNRERRASCRSREHREPCRHQERKHREEVMSEREAKRPGVDERRNAERALRQDEAGEEESEAPRGPSVST